MERCDGYPNCSICGPGGDYEVGVLAAELAEATERIRVLTRERDEAIAVAVWCFENPYKLLGSGGHFDDLPEDASDAGIYAALRAAKGDTDGE